MALYFVCTEIFDKLLSLKKSNLCIPLTVSWLGQPRVWQLMQLLWNGLRSAANIWTRGDEGACRKSGECDEQDLLDILMISMIKMKGSIPGREGRLACHTLGTWGQQEDPKTSAGISVQPINGKIYIIEKIHG